MVVQSGGIPWPRVYGSPVWRHSLHTHVMLEERGNCSEFPRAACRSRVGGNLVGYVRCVFIRNLPVCGMTLGLWYDVRGERLLPSLKARSG